MSEAALRSGLAPEGIPDLSSVPDVVGGAWPTGWYPAEIISGYSAGGYTFSTQDTPSKKGDSRNLMLCVKLTSNKTRTDEAGNAVDAGAERRTFVSYNYRLEDLTPENVALVSSEAGKAEQFIRLRIALGRLKNVQKAVGFGFKRHPEGHILPSPLIGQKVDARLGIGNNGYNEVTGFAPAGTRTSK